MLVFLVLLSYYFSGMKHRSDDQSAAAHIFLEILMRSFGPTSRPVCRGVSVQHARSSIDLVEEGGAKKAEVSERDAGLLRHPVWGEDEGGVQTLEGEKLKQQHWVKKTPDKRLDLSRVRVQTSRLTSADLLTATEPETSIVPLNRSGCGRGDDPDRGHARCRRLRLLVSGSQWRRSWSFVPLTVAPGFHLAVSPRAELCMSPWCRPPEPPPPLWFSCHRGLDDYLDPRFSFPRHRRGCRGCLETSGAVKVVLGDQNCFHGDGGDGGGLCGGGGGGGDGVRVARDAAP